MGMRIRDSKISCYIYPKNYQ